MERIGCVSRSCGWFWFRRAERACCDVRWTLETRRWYSQGFLGQSLRGHVIENVDGESRSAVRASVLDNNHLSVRLGPLEAGPLWECIKHREEKEWKGGARIAVRWADNSKSCL